MTIHVLGSINRDIVMTVPHLPKSGETLLSSDLEHHPGGKGSNQAIAAARLGADVKLYGATGLDEHGDAMRCYLREAGVDIDSVIASSVALTGQAYICVAEDGENSIVVASGANYAYRLSDLPENLSSGGIYLSQFEMPIDAVRGFLQAGREANGVCAVNAAPAVSNGQELFSLADLVIVNEVELAAYTGFSAGLSELEKLAENARELISRVNQHIIVTVGARGVLAVSGDDWQLVESRPVPVVDTTGAGDCFCGAFVAALAQGDSLTGALGFANRAAAYAVGRRGAASSLPTLGDLDE